MVSGGQSLRDDECLRCVARSLNRRLLSGRQAGHVDRPVLNLPRFQLEVTLKGARSLVRWQPKVGLSGSAIPGHDHRLQRLPPVRLTPLPARGSDIVDSLYRHAKSLEHSQQCLPRSLLSATIDVTILGLNAVGSGQVLQREKFVVSGHLSPIRSRTVPTPLGNPE